MNKTCFTSKRKRKKKIILFHDLTKQTKQFVKNSVSESRKFECVAAGLGKMTVNTPTVAGSSSRTRTCPSPSFDARSLKAGKFAIAFVTLFIFSLSRCLLFVLLLNGVCHEILYLLFSWFEPVWVPDKYAKMFLNSVSISPRYSVFFLETPRCTSQQGCHVPGCASNRWVWLRGVMHTAESEVF